MKIRKNYLLTLILPFALLVSSCSNNAEKANEPEIETMDSVSKNLDKTTKELDDRLKKVEASLEKVEKEFEPAK